MKSYVEFVTDKGNREINEDCVAIKRDDNKMLVVLADGLGGHGKGDVASQLVCKTIMELFDELSTDREFLSKCFDIAQCKLIEEQKLSNSLKAMKTTLVLVVINGNKISWSHIGDSRFYHFKNGKFIERTLDHSVPQMLVAAGEIKEKQIRHHEDRNKLLRCMGIKWDTPRYEIDKIEYEVDKDDEFILCSDGFWELITEKQMSKLLKKKNNTIEILKNMESIVLKSGKGKNMDNYSGILIRFRGE